jgi:hypothetical protein
MKPFGKLLATLSVLILAAASLFAQAPSSVIAEMPTEHHGLYSINLQDLSIAVNIPIRKKPGFSARFNGASNRTTAAYSGVEYQIAPLEVNLLSGGSIN